MSQAGSLGINSSPIPPTLLETLTANDGSVATAVANNINVLGNNNANNGFATYTANAGAGVFNIYSYGTAEWIVNPVAGLGTHQTIQAAITTATSGDTIFITPGTYTENLTLKAGVNLTSFSGEQSLNGSGHVLVIGNATFSTAGSVNINDMQLQSNGSNIISVTGSVASILNIENCYLNVTASSGILFSSSSSSASVNIRQSTVDLTTTGISYFTHSSAGTLLIDYSRFTNSGASTTASTASAGAVLFFYSRFGSPLTTSGTNDFEAYYTRFVLNGNVTLLTLGGSGEQTIDTCTVETNGSGSLISISSTASVVNTVFDGSNAAIITGAGTLRFGGLSFFGSSSGINTTTQVPLVSSNDAVKVITPGAYPYTVLPQDAFIIVDSSAARTINLTASPPTGQRVTIKDNVGSAAANNITITPAAGNIDGAASYVINVNYGSVDLVYNGTQWNVR